MTTTTHSSIPAVQKSWFPIACIGLLFFIFGFVTWINSALIPFLQMVCELSEIEALFIAFCFYFAYVVMAIPMAKILEKTGYQKGMSLGLVIIALGCLLFVPAAITKTFAVFLVAQFVVGSGLTILQTASNPYVVRLGPEESAAARIAIMGLLNKAAGALAPVLFTVLVLGNFADITQASLAQMDEASRLAKIDSMSAKLITPYVGIAIALGLLALVFGKISLPDLAAQEQEESQSHQPANSVLAFPHLVLGAVTLFCYVGVEVIAGDTIGLYGSSLGVANATSLGAYTMTAMVIGYLLGLILIPKLISQSDALLFSAGLGLALSLAIVFASNTSTVISSVIWGWAGIQVIPDTLALIALLGLANAMVWPAVWPLALEGLGNMTAKGSAVLVMGIAGGAILPLVYGVVGEVSSSQVAYSVTIPCYAFIAYYALRGHKKRSW